MPCTLGLDLGTRKTGVAFFDERIGFPLPLPTIRHTSEEELIEQISKVVAEKDVSQLVVGLPLLPSGEEGSQAKWVRKMVEKLGRIGCPITLKDERYTTPPKGISPEEDAYAAIGLLMRKEKDNQGVDKS